MPYKRMFPNRNASAMVYEKWSTVKRPYRRPLYRQFRLQGIRIYGISGYKEHFCLVPNGMGFHTIRFFTYMEWISDIWNSVEAVDAVGGLDGLASVAREGQEAWSESETHTAKVALRLRDWSAQSNRYVHLSSIKSRMSFAAQIDCARWKVRNLGNPLRMNRATLAGCVPDRDFADRLDRADAMPFPFTRSLEVWLD